ncbi:MAG: hypothetical protein WB630_10490 [Candidatus Acidiferrales bacterium]|jgi:hypothetical protein
MKRLLSLSVLLLMLLWVTPDVQAQSATNSIQPGTRVRLTLVDGLTSNVAHDGDPFTAIVAEPVFVGNDVLLPAGAKIHGTVTGVTRPKWFAMVRGGASMNLVFNSIEVQSRIFPVQMSIISLYSGNIDTTKQRKDVKTIEGVVVEEKRDIKGDIMTAGLGTGGGALVGVLFSNVARGTVIGLVGTSAYIMAKKGKDVELPAQTGMLVRLDSSVTLPASLLHNTSYSPPTGGN